MDDPRKDNEVEEFRKEGHLLVDQLSEYLLSARHKAMPVYPGGHPREWASKLPALLPSGDSVSLEEFVQGVLAGSIHLHHPGYVGHQVTAPSPRGALLQLVGALLNNGMAVHEMGPVVTAMEHEALRFLGATLGLGEGAGGVLTSGGSVGNLTALLSARQAMAGYDVWAKGVAREEPMVFLTSDQAHYSVDRAVRVLGLGSQGVQALATDENFRLRGATVEQGLAAAWSKGVRVLGVVASAGSTATGAVDELDAIADVCERYGVWLHVDGAHGASVALGPKYKTLLRGIERADSVVWDAHKMLQVPALVTAVLYRNRAHSLAAFAQKAAYLFHDGESAGAPRDEDFFDVGRRTLECTKRMMGLELYGALLLHGPERLGAYVDACIDQARRFSDAIEAADDFDLALRPDLNIVCFRYKPRGGAGSDHLQSEIRRRILQEGNFYLVQTVLRGETYLRVTLLNPATRDEDLEALLASIRRVGEGLLRNRR